MFGGTLWGGYFDSSPNGRTPLGAEGEYALENPALADFPRGSPGASAARIAMRSALLASAMALQANAAGLRGARAEQLPTPAASPSAGASGGVRALRLAGPWQRAPFRFAEELPVAPSALHEVGPTPRPIGRWSWVVPRPRASAEELPVAAATIVAEAPTPTRPRPWPAFGRAPVVVREELPIAPATSAGASGGVRALRLAAPWPRPQRRTVEELPSAATPTLFEAGPPPRRPITWPEFTVVALTGGGDELALPLVHEEPPRARPPMLAPWRRQPPVVVREELPIAPAPALLEAPPRSLARWMASPFVVPHRARVSEELPRVPLAEVAPRRVLRPFAPLVRVPAVRAEELPHAPLLETAPPTRPFRYADFVRVPAIRSEELPTPPALGEASGARQPRPWISGFRVPPRRWSEELLPGASVNIPEGEGTIVHVAVDHTIAFEIGPEHTIALERIDHTIDFEVGP